MAPKASSAFAAASRGPSIVENRGDCDALAPMSAHRLGDLIDSFLIERYGSDIGPASARTPQISAPMPWDPPVTQARLPSIERRYVHLDVEKPPSFFHSVSIKSVAR